MRLIDGDALIADCQLAQKQADRHGREFANAFYSGGGEISTEWWCVEDMIENAPTIEPERKKGEWIVIVKGCKLTSYKCSECGRYIADDTGYDVKEDYPFCHCGADMREGNNE